MTLLSARLLLDCLLCSQCLRSALSVGAHTYRDRADGILCVRRPICGLPDRQRAKQGQQLQGLSALVEQGQVGQVRAQHHIALAADHMAQATPVRKAAVSHDHIALADRKARQALTNACLGDVHLIAAERAQVQRIVQSPGRTRGAGFAHRAAIDQAHPPARQKSIDCWRQGHVGRHLLGHPLEPVPAAAQSLEQRHIGHGGQTARTCTHCRLAQRAPICQVNEQHSKQRGNAVKAAQSSHCPKLNGLGLPLRRQHLHHHLPILTDACQLTHRKIVWRNIVNSLLFRRLIHNRSFQLVD